MIHSYIHNGSKYAIDTVTGKAYSLSALEFTMLGYLKPPLSAHCPVSLRYNLAKFTLSDVEKAYKRLSELFADSVGKASSCEANCPDECAGCWANALCKRYSSSLSPDDVACSEEKNRIEGEAAVTCGEQQ